MPECGGLRIQPFHKFLRGQGHYPNRLLNENLYQFNSFTRGRSDFVKMYLAVDKPKGNTLNWKNICALS
jgi:hypothetical protein